MKQPAQYSKCNICPYRYETPKGCWDWRRDECRDLDICDAYEDDDKSVKIGRDKHFFDETNRIKESRFYSNDGSLSGYTEYYYKHGYIIKMEKCDTDGNTTVFEDWQYDNNFNLLKHNSLTYNSDGSAELISKNEKGEIVERTLCDKDGNLIDKTEMPDSEPVDAGVDTEDIDNYEDSNEWRMDL